MKFTFFATKESTKPQGRDWTWEKFATEISSGHKVIAPGQKDFVWHFNAVEYREDGRRQSSDAKLIHALVLDYDSGETDVDAFHRWGFFSHLEFVLYTSFNHQREREAGYEKRDKFRVILPFETPMPASVWAEVSDYVLNELVPAGCDRSIKNVNLHYTYAYAPDDNAEKARVIWNKSTGGYQATHLGWSQWPRQTPGSGSGLYQSKPAAHHLEPSHVFKTATGDVRFDTVTGYIGKVYCPHHADKKPGSFLNRKARTIFHHCPKCGTTKIIEQVFREAAERKPTTKIELYSDLVEVSERVVEPYSREKRGELLRDKYFAKRRDVTLLMSFEGFGKSYCAVLEAKRGRKVLFASFSNAQAEEQAEEFRSHGLRVQAVIGREHQLWKRHEISAVTTGRSHPWDVERVAEAATKKKIAEQLKLKSDLQVDRIWEECAPEEPDWDNNDIICTTIARANSWGRMNEKVRAAQIAFRHRQMNSELRFNKTRPASEDEKALFGADTETIEFAEGDIELADVTGRIPANVVTFFDDPDKEMFCWYYPYEEKWKDKTIDDKPIEVKTINGREYFVRPNHLKIGYGIEGRIVFTTTEIITSHLITALYKDVYTPKLIPDEKMDAGDITVIKTSAVGSKRDGFLPPVVQRLKKEGFEFEYIGDGQGATFNLANNRGQNVLKNVDTVIEISEPARDVVTRFLDELEWEEGNRSAIRTALALDAAQQAIGRNCGYRWSDQGDPSLRKKAVVLCEPKLFEALLKYMRYFVRTPVARARDRVTLKRDYKTLCDAVCWYLTYIDRYIRDGVPTRDGKTRAQAFEDDIKSVFESVSAPNRYRFTSRLKYAIRKAVEKGDDTRLIARLMEVWNEFWPDEPLDLRVKKELGSDSGPT